MTFTKMYSYTEILKTFKISKTKLDRYLAEQGIEPDFTKPITLKSMVYLVDVPIVAKYYGFREITDLMKDKGIEIRNK